MSFIYNARMFTMHCNVFTMQFICRELREGESSCMSSTFVHKMIKIISLVALKKRNRLQTQFTAVPYRYMRKLHAYMWKLLA